MYSTVINLYRNSVAGSILLSLAWMRSVARGKSGCCSLLVDCYIADVGKMLINLTFIASLEKCVGFGLLYVQQQQKKIYM